MYLHELARHSQQKDTTSRKYVCMSTRSSSVGHIKAHIRWFPEPKKIVLFCQQVNLDLMQDKPIRSPWQLGRQSVRHSKEF